MKLSEKILSLRTARGLSQGDLAEKLEVSRQSVSKWETGQSVPDLDKIIKIADLFGVTVDELVREEANPKGQEQSRPEPQVFYMEKQAQTGLALVQIMGIIVECFGGSMILFGLAGEGRSLILVGLMTILWGLSFLFRKTFSGMILIWLCTIIMLLFVPVAGLFLLVFSVAAERNEIKK